MERNLEQKCLMSRSRQKELTHNYAATIDINLRTTSTYCMNRILPFLCLCLLVLNARAQNANEPYGQVSQADFDLKQCSFEKDANAEVLSENVHVYYKYSTVVMEYFKRIKIFNDKGNDAAKVRIEYYGRHNDESVSDVQAETINFSNGKAEYTAVDKPSIFTQNVDKELKAVTFTFPNIRPGSIVEYKYKWTATNAGNFPDWLIQGDFPVRHTEFKAEFSKDFTFKYVWRIHQKLTKDTSYYTNGKNMNQGNTHIWILDSVRSLKEEPFMTPMIDNSEHILFQVTGYYERTWLKMVKALLNDIDFGNELDARVYLGKENEVEDKIKSLPTLDARVAYVYNLVKGSMKFNDKTSIFTDAEIKRAWAAKNGNSAEMNFVIYHFLKNAGLEPSLALLNGVGNIETNYATYTQLKRVAVYLRADSGKYYLLDASVPDGRYNEIPYYALNRNALVITPATGSSTFITCEYLTPVKESIAVNGDMTADGKLNGTSQINSSGYDKERVKKRYKDDGEKKYRDYLRDDNNHLSISSLRMDNMEVDSLPLTQTIDFKLDELPGSDENYIYLNPNLFTRIHANPFLSEERFSDIDFKYLTFLNINGRYKIPAGFKIDAMPKSQMVVMPDRSIVFKRVIAEDEGNIVVHYTINFGRSYFKKDEYPIVREFYRKMFDMLNEQIVLKKT